MKTLKPNVKVKFRREPGEIKGKVLYQIDYKGKITEIETDYVMTQSEWDNRGEVAPTGVGGYIVFVREGVKSDIVMLEKAFENKKCPEKAATAYRALRERCSFGRFMRGWIMRMKQNGRYRTSETYRCSLKSFMKFLRGSDIMFDVLTGEIMAAYEAWLAGKGVCANTASFYLRNLRAVYNRAVDEGLTADRAPFRKVYTGIDRTARRALPLRAMKEIRSIDLSGYPAVEYARDMFMLSFYLRGMSFVDMVFLKKSDLQYGQLIYRRRKTGQMLMILWTREMQAIVDKYPSNPTEYLLPIITDPSVSTQSVYRNKGYNINQNLKKLRSMIGLQSPLTMYVARHSWATTAVSQGVPLRVISAGLGHESEKTTQIYLASLDTSTIDRANSLIIKCVE